MRLPDTMTAYGYTAHGGPEHQDWLELPVPRPGPGELLVEVRAAGVNPADWKARDATSEIPPGELPAVLGREVAGIVRAVGVDVESSDHSFAEGDEVFGSTAPGAGGYAPYTLLTAASAAPKPPQVTFTDAAALPVAAGTAYDALHQLGLGEGRTLLLNGIGGGVGVAAAQLARNAGIAVFGTGSEAKRPLVESLGAVLVGRGPGVAEQVRALLPDGVDAVLDMVGGDALRAVADLVADRSRLLSIADKPLVAELGGGPVERRRTTAVYAEVAAIVAAGELDPHVTDVRPLTEAAEALAGIEAGHALGKTVLTPNG